MLSPLGCGKVLGGTVDSMWESLKKIKALPADTMLYCAHEHSERNYKFARSIDRENEAIRARGQKIRENIAAGSNISVPFLLADEIALNPFLRADTPEMAELVGMPKGRTRKTFLTKLVGAGTWRIGMADTPTLEPPEQSSPHGRGWLALSPTS